MKFGGPLITTSANLSGEPAYATCKEMCNDFKKRKNIPDITFKGAIRNACLPSTIILVDNKKIKIVREGPMTKAQLEDILGVTIT